ncbi:hypothetical protein LCGC14_0643710 [marine sediment metagenome]|uniref:Uncharacterized protein n=1 Tax=marine sediment metagenome TaxID=412755 RepID=A0A0F9QYJ3_9ZZZZ|nr:hypothetical protein [Pricia sp.]
MNYIGDFLEDATVYIPFNTFDSNDPSASVTITNLAAGDVEVWKNGVVQPTPGSGVTVTLNIGTNNGTHLIAIDTSDTTDVGWFVINADYQVRINGTTVDGATINAWVGTFSIENRYNAIVDNNLDHLMKVATSNSATLPEVVDDTILANIMTKTDGDTSDFDFTTDSLEAIRDHAATIKAETATIVTDTNEIQGKLPTNKFMGSSDGADDDGTLNTIATDTTTDIPALIATAQSDLDKLTGSDGATLATTQGNYAPAKAGDAMDLVANAVDVSALAADAVDEIIDEVIEGSITLRQVMKLVLSVLTGISSGGGTDTIVFRDIGDTKDRILATVDSNGNRTAIGTRDGS